MYSSVPDIYIVPHFIIYLHVITDLYITTRSALRRQYAPTDCVHLTCSWLIAITYSGRASAFSIFYVRKLHVLA